MESIYPPMVVSIVVSNMAELKAVYALLGGASAVVMPGMILPGTELIDREAFMAAGGDENNVQEVKKAIKDAQTQAGEAPVGDAVIDAHGWPWSEDLHASTQGKTKDGLWRMKVGVSRPNPKPGYPIGDTGTGGTGEVSKAADTAATETAGPDEDDEFAAFREAAEKSDTAAAAAKAAIPPRKWTDADLGALCNQAASKLGDPSPVKETISKFVPEGEVAHSRNIPEDQRAAFAAAVEERAGIEFAG